MILVSQPWILLPGIFTKEVDVEIGDGWMVVEPATFGRSHTIVFNVTNVGSEPHMFLVLDADLTAGNLPVENSQVRSSPYSDEPYDLHWLDPSGHDVVRLGAARGSSISPAEGPIIEPGETREIDYVWGYDRFPSGLRLILFCNYPGHYERGEYTTLTIK
jgi:hypothetical protein